MPVSGMVRPEAWFVFRDSRRPTVTPSLEDGRADCSNFSVDRSVDGQALVRLQP
jgi:hypothetical protein